MQLGISLGNSGDACVGIVSMTQLASKLSPKFESSSVHLSWTNDKVFTFGTIFNAKISVSVLKCSFNAKISVSVL